ncbi:hypothetical protein EPN90_02680 [Patescibacteria group bacterium]|nr:MAG: hypothetical protein EPN90_02680 [Patescibacteria group bacterium]
MLQLKRYGWLCVLGTEVFYVVCLIYGTFLTGKTAELHHSLFELLPGFVWGNIGSIIFGAVYLFVFAWVFAWYIVWMHNTSLVKAVK